MIAFLEGEVAELREGSAVLRVGGVGLEVFAPTGTLAALRQGESARLHTRLVVKEELLALYGFAGADQLELFTHLTGVSGIGPRLALAILSTLPGNMVATAIADGDAGLLASAPGVGKRTAERIILELAGRLPEHLLAGEGRARAAGQEATPAAADAVEALLALGFREGRVKTIVAELTAASPGDGAEAIIRKALSKLR